MVNIYRKLAHLLNSQEKIDELKHYVQTGEKPKHQGLRRGRIYEQFDVVRGELIYDPLSLVVVPPDRKNEVLQSVWDDPERSIMRGIAKFYEEICKDYVGITRYDVQKFLQRKAVYQVRSRPITKVTNKPNIGSYPAQKYAIDLVDMSAFNDSHRYILDCIDLATSYLYSRPLKHKTGADVARALQSIFDEDGKIPKYCLSDGGGEFTSPEVKELSRRLGIKRAITRSYTPTSNPLCERVNQAVRRGLSDMMVRNNTTRWVQYLPTVVNAWNSSTHGRQKQTPEFLFLSQAEDVEQERAEALSLIKEKAKKALAKNTSDSFPLGCIVRVSMRVLSTKYRKAVKEGKNKLLPVKYSPELFRVVKIIVPSNETLAKRQYELERLDGTALVTEVLANDARTRIRKPTRVYATDMLKVAKNKNEVSDYQKLPLSLLKINRDGNVQLPAQAPATTTRRATTRVVRADRNNERTSNQRREEEASTVRRSQRERRMPTYLRDYDT